MFLVKKVPQLEEQCAFVERMRDIPKRSGTRQPPALRLPSGNDDRSTSQNSAKLTAFRLILQLFLLEMDRDAFTRREHVVDATIDANHAIKKGKALQ